ncbi:unnamed protein product [Didymodactylos carnosus]|uniref:NAD(P)(+)--arginine ADP-ribosyltransferase n=1 Tax=Didymodactylos carnosus TaxID=1234261 RepID=A0A815EV44_9BILA|nr:unnamed protein product [Didymodactylos carnosus]CAF4164428.1 unnamed protein product [Didymodactylos carnosus]
MASSKTNWRYLDDIRDEPKQVLKPITGYAKLPLMTLDEAVKPLLHIVNELPQNVWVAKENCKKCINELTQDEAAAIHLYTMEWDQRSESLYAILNRTLREIDRQKLIPWFSYLKLLLTALHKLPSEKAIVWRGVKADLRADYDPGKKQVWWALSSCTTKMNVLESSEYLGTSGNRTMFSIECSNGKMIKQYSYFEKEDEILLMPGSYFHIVDQLCPAKELNIIHLKEETPPYPLLELPFNKTASDNGNSSLVQSLRSLEIDDISIRGISDLSSTPFNKNTHGIWLDSNINNTPNNLLTQHKLRSVFNILQTFEVKDIVTQLNELMTSLQKNMI